MKKEQIIRRVSFAIKANMAKAYTFVYGLFHKIEKKIVCSSFGGKQYSDNPRAISEKMHEMFPDFEIVWVLDKQDVYNVVPEYVRTVSRKNDKLCMYKELATCFCYITNVEIATDIYKKRKQFFLQTWHGDRGFKKVLYDVEDQSMSSYKIMDYTLTDCCIAGSTFGEGVYRSAFRYEGEIMKVGSPRDDKLFSCLSSDEMNLIKNRIGINNHQKVLLFAPTFRDFCIEKQPVNVELKNVLDCLGADWVCLIRAHEASKGLDYCGDNRFIDVSDYFDMADLLGIADFLITDYSSSCCDFAITGKPVILAIFDREEYEANSRTFIVDPEATGFCIAKSNTELIDLIKETTLEDFAKYSAKALEYYGAYEIGNSCEKICTRISNEYKIKVRKEQP